MRIYVDFDDVVSETARYFTGLVKFVRCRIWKDVDMLLERL